MQDLFPLGEKTLVRTEYGTATLYRSSAGRREFLFLPRHGEDHSIPPHRINFKANLRALKKSGAEGVIATSAVGSITRRLQVGEMGLLDQFIDFSKRHLTYFDKRPVHVDMTRPYDPVVQRLLLDAADRLRVRLEEGLVYASVDGPRYETVAEIRMFGLLGADVVGMTGAPEAILANELGMRYASLVVATNWAAGLQAKITHEEVEAMMSRTSPRIRKLIQLAIKSA